MSDTVDRPIVEAFYRALTTRDRASLDAFLDENVSWTISGPVDILPFCGQRVGKVEVLRLLTRDTPNLLSDLRFAAKVMLVDGDRASLLGRLTATKRDAGRSISYRVAHFIQFRDGKVVEYVSIIDSFDAVEQMLGHSLEPQARVDGDRIAV